MAAPRVLISYSHDSPEHAAAVLALADALRAAGVDAHLDQYDPFPKVGWPAWMREKLVWAQKIIAVCTPTYRERFEHHNPAGVGLGASWEGLLAELTIYRDRRRRGDFVPVLLDDATPDDIPLLLSELTHHTLTDAAPTQSLLRHLFDQPAATKPPLGTPEPLAQRPPRSSGHAAPPSDEDRADALSHAIAHARALGDVAQEDDLREALRQLNLEPNARLNVGDVVHNRYHISRRLGEGGFATVWAAVEPLSSGRLREVALKLLHAQHTDSATVRKRLQKATADHAQLSDPGVVRVHDAWGEEGDRCWTVMELVTGGDLERAVHAGELDPLAAVRLCLEVGRTLARLHGLQVIHADVKPSNILIDHLGRPLLSDFDLAKNLKLSRLGKTQRIGDALFSCPEQQSKKPIDYRWDVYAISVTALWCASGGSLELVHLMLRELPTLSLPAPVIAALQRGADPRQAQRTPDMATWCRDLEAALAADTIVPPTAPTAPRTAPKQALRRLVAASRPRPASSDTAEAPTPTPPTQAPSAAPAPRPPPPKAPPRPTPPDDLRSRLAASAIAPPADPTDPATLTPGARRTLLLPGDVPLDLAWIPAGTFWMGSPVGVGHADERPRRQVTLTRPYWLGVTPVTQAQWAAVATGTELPPSPSHFPGADRPVEQVSWDDARAWCNALSACLGLTPAYPDLTEPGAIDWTSGARLPTEAEWERACRAGTDTAFSFGKDPAALADHAWFEANSGNETHPVATRRPNPWGLHDVHGNVWEWCWDGWRRDYTAGAVVDPRHPPSRGDRCARGGSFGYPAVWCRSATRYLWDPTGRYRVQGLRVVVPAPADALTLAS